MLSRFLHKTIDEGTGTDRRHHEQTDSITNRLTAPRQCKMQPIPMDFVLASRDITEHQSRKRQTSRYRLAQPQGASHADCSATPHTPHAHTTPTLTPRTTHRAPRPPSPRRPTPHPCPTPCPSSTPRTAPPPLPTPRTDPPAPESLQTTPFGDSLYTPVFGNAR